MNDVVYFNGPVQNGDFTFAERPGKAAGIRLAEALNALLGLAPVPHLWNTVTLAGDVRHRRAADRDAVGRQQREEQTLAAKYAPGPAPAGGLLTDTDPQVASLALEMTRALLADGTLAVQDMPVRLCARCGHMAGTGTAGDCRSCGHGTIRAARRALLVSDRTAHGPVLGRDDVHAVGARTPAHLLNIAHNIPRLLALSRTRDHGVDLAPLGLEGMVLDPRAGLHVAVLAAAGELGAPAAGDDGDRERRGQRGRLRRPVPPARRDTTAVRAARENPLRDGGGRAAVRGAPRPGGTGSVHRLVPAAVRRPGAGRCERRPDPGPAEVPAPGLPRPARHTPR
ncbi:hypothetical protein [Streptomyces atratus]